MIKEKNFYSISSLVLYEAQDKCLELQNKVIQKLPHLAKYQSNLLHLSFHSIQKSYPPIIKEELKKICIHYHQFETKISGLGIFNKKKYTIYLPVVKNRTLLELQEKIFNVVEKISPSPQTHQFYHLDNWIPHISLFYDVDSLEDVVKATEILLKEKLTFSLPVKTVSEIGRIEEDIEVKDIINFSFYLK